MSYPKGPPPVALGRGDGSIAESVVTRSNHIVEGTQELSQIQQVAAQQMQRVMHATSTLQDAAIQSAVIAAGSTPAGMSSGEGPQISASGGTVKISQPTSIDSKTEGMQSLLIQALGQIIPLIVNVVFLKVGIQASPDAQASFIAILLQFAGAGVASLTLNTPYLTGKKHVHKG